MQRLPVLVLLLCGCRASWGLDAVDTLSTQLDQPVVCANTSPVDTHADERAACTFGKGARAEQTLGLPPASASQLPIRHVIVLMRENRSFDHLLGRLHGPAVEAVPADFTNLDLVGRAVTPFTPATTCEAVDPDHQWGGMHLGINGGLMNGFVASAGYSTDTDGHFVMGVHDATDLPFYSWLASTFALGSRHFAPLATGTYPNRYFLMFGSNLGFRSTTLATYPPAGTPSIFSELLDAKATWGVYSDGAVLSGSLGWKQGEPGVHSFQAFLDALDQGTLPNVAFVDGIDNVEDDHPPADLQVGERWLANIYQHAAKSPQWSRLAMVWTYDESGAFADHVPPPQGCAPSSSTEDQAFVERGPRVPLVLISPWAKRGYVSTAVRDHTAITRLIETLFDLPALSRRDANSDAMLDLFDFSCGRDLTAPVAPEPGRGGCVAP